MIVIHCLKRALLGIKYSYDCYCGRLSSGVLFHFCATDNQELNTAAGPLNQAKCI